MTEPFRSSGRLCPGCAQSEVRERDGHLACDACHGALLRADELAAIFEGLDGASEAIVVRDPTPETVRCPRCDRAMQRVTLQRGSHLLPGRFLACARDGLWAPRETLDPAYARGRRVLPSTRAAAGARRDARPRIGQYERARPVVRTPFVSRFRGQRLTCPICPDQVLGLAVDRWVCKGCAGSFVEDVALIAMISELVRAPWELAAPAGSPGERACPVCARAMTIEPFEGVAVDRCGDHGHWFSAPDLQAALEHAGIHRS